MRGREVIYFNQKFITVVIEHERCCRRFLRKRFGLSYSSFSLMNALAEKNSPTSVEQLQEYLLLSRKTVLALLLVLEDAGLVYKDHASEDGRMMAVSLSEKGKACYRDISRGLEEYLSCIFWKELPKKEFLKVMLRDIESGVDILRGRPVERFRNEAADLLDILSGEVLTFWRVMPDRWADTVSEESSLTLNEYRILALLEEVGTLSAYEIADALLISKSNVSTCQERMIKANYLQKSANPFDKRSVLLSTTAQGRKLVRNLTDVLTEFTRSIFLLVPEGDVPLYNAWFFRAYSNMKSYLSRDRLSNEAVS